jgi:dihydrolipoamide dehydrogenase
VRFRELGIAVHENFGNIDSFERTPAGTRMHFSRNGAKSHADAALVVVAVGWTANVRGLELDRAGVELNARGFVRVDDQLRTSVPHIYAAGDITGRLMLVPQAIQDGFVAASHALLGEAESTDREVIPIGSFTDPEYAQVGLTERGARASHEVVVVKVPFESTTRTLIDGRTFGFCKLIVDRRRGTILGCHVVGERAVDIVQTAAIAIAGQLRVERLARLPLSFPTYSGVLGRAAAMAARQLQRESEGLSSELHH